MSWIKEFSWSWRGVRVKETGAFIPFSAALLYDCWRGWSYIVAETLRPRPNLPPINAKFEPRVPKQWYLIWGAMRQANVRPTIRPDSDLTIFFQDETHITPSKTGTSGINASCLDISKTRVAEVFADVFGYDLAIDPLTAATPFVAKSEINGTHDGRVLTAPEPPKPGWVYQRLIDNSTEDGHVADIRCPTVFGQIPLVFLKERPVTQRFANLNTRCRIDAPQDHLSETELRNVSQFCQQMGLDWGGLDILRDKADGRIYIVDVNKTDMGPPLALSLRDKLRATKILGTALRQALETRLSAGSL
ncbi:hypothetical protein ACJ3XI_02785 [Litorimonas sp. RW-G-Af-16]|uniref:hypothetical protein n=1 Tax=Litorimonas sp. RW-G-Af-16 TaxID=3241168 RepID=UPI00390C584D